MSVRDVVLSILQAGKTGLDTIRKVSQAGLNKAATTVVSSAIMVRICRHYTEHKVTVSSTAKFSVHSDNLRQEY